MLPYIPYGLEGKAVTFLWSAEIIVASRERYRTLKYSYLQALLKSCYILYIYIYIYTQGIVRNMDLFEG